MGLEKLTTKLQEALQAAQRLASKSAHAELKSAHVLLALLLTPVLNASFLGGRAPVDGGRVGAVGYCMGGQLALYAATLDPRIGAVADYYGAQGAGPAEAMHLNRAVNDLRAATEVVGQQVDFVDIEHTTIGRGQDAWFEMFLPRFNRFFDVQGAYNAIFGGADR